MWPKPRGSWGTRQGERPQQASRVPQAHLVTGGESEAQQPPSHMGPLTVLLPAPGDPLVLPAGPWPPSPAASGLRPLFPAAGGGCSRCPGHGGLCLPSPQSAWTPQPLS